MYNRLKDRFLNSAQSEQTVKSQQAVISQTTYRISNKIMCARANTQTLEVGWYGVVLVRIGSLYLAASVPYRFFNNGVTRETSLTCTRTFPIVKEYKTCNTMFRKQTAFVFRWTNLQSVTTEKVLMHISGVNSLCSNYIKRVIMNKPGKKKIRKGDK
jgi:hypothetical protein